ncbi:uncharacterized protein SPPG_07574 [Spizellomyces punctatus DAOM BR117]|uniref:Calcipressin n=1 Tax=Spizellomyces punctatus (strain DAOM BR117) TaxID=645134 RepID=A0A0L0H8A6_SPIPD|nr:uncharacterized protein SPPG_07574 [Spizellomyces punctatus DAOM BR117]KNC97186.1 hypothetical protein SPPG_07574 [Spizellomyces punctatus DAOM BR117]|eukprot:XP_016605226.1 hypothetical protein SPPG_07574 [Spizellomyces punctatus DAOM BR117]
MPAEIRLPTLEEVEPIATNTLILTNVPPKAFQDEGAAVRTILESYGRVNHFVLLKSFSRILAVFEVTADAQRARNSLHMNPILGDDVRVYFGEHTDSQYLLNPTTGIHINYLQVPTIERNFLLSPPGSPPIDWVQHQEHSPVPGGHADALLDALRELEGDTFVLDPGDAEDTMDTPGRQVLVFDQGEEAELPVIVVDDMELRQPWWPEDEPTGVRPSQLRSCGPSLPRTAMPPPPVSS